MTIQATIFDLDGTLIDSNAEHVEAWRRTLEAHGYDVSTEAIGREVGKGGDTFVPSLLGKEAEERDGDSLRDGHTQEYLKIIQERRLVICPGAEPLLAELKRRGVQIVLATSSKEKELKAAQRSAAIDLEKMADQIITADDADQSKPAPDLVIAAVKKANMSPHDCLMVGDTPYDVQAASGAGVACVGLTCGRYNDAEQLKKAGATAVFRDPADLLVHLDGVLNRGRSK